MRYELNHLIDELFCIDAEMMLVEALLRQHLQRAEKLGDHPTIERIQGLLGA
ncbi:MAG: hypothetical protein ACK46X_03035 [Candidatus Sericytochromatia bacterium]